MSSPWAGFIVASIFGMWFIARVAKGTDYNSQSQRWNEIVPGAYTGFGIVILLAELMGKYQMSMVMGGVFVVLLLAPLLGAMYDSRVKKLMAKTLETCDKEDEAIAMCIVHIGILTKPSAGHEDDLKVMQLAESHCEHCKEPACPLRMEIRTEVSKTGDEGWAKWVSYLCRVVHRCVEKFPGSVELRLLEVILLLDCAKEGLVAWVTIHQLLRSEKVSILERIQLLHYK